MPRKRDGADARTPRIRAESPDVPVSVAVPPDLHEEVVAPARPLAAVRAAVERVRDRLSP